MRMERRGFRQGEGAGKEGEKKGVEEGGQVSLPSCVKQECTRSRTERQLGWRYSRGPKTTFIVAFVSTGSNQERTSDTVRTKYKQRWFISFSIRNNNGDNIKTESFLLTKKYR